MYCMHMRMQSEVQPSISPLPFVGIDIDISPRSPRCSLPTGVQYRAAVRQMDRPSLRNFPAATRSPSEHLVVHASTRSESTFFPTTASLRVISRAYAPNLSSQGDCFSVAHYKQIGRFIFSSSSSAHWKRITDMSLLSALPAARMRIRPFITQSFQ